MFLYIPLISKLEAAFEYWLEITTVQFAERNKIRNLRTSTCKILSIHQPKILKLMLSISQCIQCLYTNFANIVKKVKIANSDQFRYYYTEIRELDKDGPLDIRYQMCDHMRNANIGRTLYWKSFSINFLAAFLIWNTAYMQSKLLSIDSVERYRRLWNIASIYTSDKFMLALLGFTCLNFWISNFFGLSITEETLLVEMCIWCIQ
jgi:hypothetical protein